MTDDRGTIKLPRDIYERHNERRKQAGLSWGEYVDEEAVTIEYNIDTDAIAREVAAQIDYAALADSVAEEVVQSLRDA